MTFICVNYIFWYSLKFMLKLSQQRMITMKLDLNIGIGQKQGLNLTAQVQQAIKLLQMTNLELTE